MNRSRNILWVVGQQLAGKTTFSNIFRGYGVPVLNIGETLRRKYKVDDFIRSENSYAPKFAETEVQLMISEFLVNTADTGLCVIDSAPRNPEQFTQMMCHIEISQLVLVKQPHVLRHSRALLKYSGKLEYFNDREVHERAWMEYIEAKIAMYHIPTIRVGVS